MQASVSACKTNPSCNSCRQDVEIKTNLTKIKLNLIWHGCILTFGFQQLFDFLKIYFYLGRLFYLVIYPGPVWPGYLRRPGPARFEISLSRPGPARFEILLCRPGPAEMLTSIAYLHYAPRQPGSPVDRQ